MESKLEQQRLEAERMVKEKEEELERIRLQEEEKIK